MQITTLEEPCLLFGTGKHVDIRYGLLNYCPLDFDSESAPKKIRLGVVGDSKSIEELKDWLEKCRGEIEAKKSHQRNLFPDWPGFNTEAVFCSELQFDSSLERQISSSDIKTISALAVRDEQIIRAVDLIVTEVQLLLEKKPDVIACAIPQGLLEALNPVDESINLDEEEDVEKGKKATIDFHHLLKAKCMTLPRACPIQLVLPATYNSKYKRRGRSRKDIRPLQDEATRAWNFHTALYYKAGGIPWKLQEDTTKLQTCFVGVGFYRTLDQERILTSVAQVFNERGNGVVVRGEQAIFEKEDRQIHLDRKGANALLSRALKQYRSEHKTMPARVVVHKTSSHNDEEMDGFCSAAEENNIEYCELVSLRSSFIRLFRNGEYPPLRGTFLSLDDRSNILYTRGSVEFYGTYPGMYMPRTLRIECDLVEQTPRYLAEEILSLTKMNWNDTQFDGGMPITIRAARQVGDILKYLGTSSPVPAQYSFYM